MKTRHLLLAIGLALLAAACAHQPAPSGGAPLPGFLIGLLHGYISLFSLIASLFIEVRIYAFPNNGFFYDFGFVLGAMMFYGSGHSTYSYTRRR